MVEFPLQPGDYLLQFSGSLTPEPEIMVVKLPGQPLPSAPALP
jgi:hypothetical protein